MKKIVTLVAVVLLTLSSVAYASKGITNGDNSQTKESSKIILPSKVNAKEASERNNTVENYIKLIGLNKKELISTLGEEPTSIDEGGLQFSGTDIRVWFKDYGNGPVEQVYIDNRDVDFKGVRLGDKISGFVDIFGEPVEEHTTFAYSNFKYKGIVLSVYYDPKTETTFAVYILNKNVK